MIAVTLLLVVTPGAGVGQTSSLPGKDTHVPCPSGSKPVSAGCIDANPVLVERCRSARKAVPFFRAHTWERQSARGGTLAAKTPIVRGKSCRWARYAAGVWVARAKAAAKKLAAWEDEWAWERWLPAKWYRIARCETGLRWDWNSGAYQGAFGFAVSSWDSFRLPGYPSEGYLATPRQQYEVALAIWRRYGFSGWGCRGA